jgi:hypothetical protein
MRTSLVITTDRSSADASATGQVRKLFGEIMIDGMLEIGTTLASPMSARISTSLISKSEASEFAIFFSMFVNQFDGSAPPVPGFKFDPKMT